LRHDSFCQCCAAGFSTLALRSAGWGYPSEESHAVFIPLKIREELGSRIGLPFERWISFRRSRYVYETVAIISLRIYQRGGEHSARTWIDDLRQATLDIRVQLDKNLGTRGLNVELPGVTPKAFPSEVDTGTLEENTGKQKT
jgi:hypothetical protein